MIAWSIFSDCYLQPAMEMCGFSLHKKKLNALFTSISISNSTFKIIHCHLHVLKHTEKHASKYDVLQNNKQVNPSRKKYDWNLKTLLIVSIPYSDHMQTKHAKLFPQKWSRKKFCFDSREILIEFYLCLVADVHYFFTQNKVDLQSS